MQATGITIPQVEFAVNFLYCSALVLCEATVEWNEECVRHLLECAGKGDKQIVHASF